MAPHPLRSPAAVLLTLVVLTTAACGGDPAESSQRPAETAGPAAATDPTRSPTGSPTTSPAPSAGVDLPAYARAQAPWQVVRQIETSELAIRDDRTPGRALAEAGRLQQLAYRALAERPAWDQRVRELLAPRWRGVVADNIAARREMLDMQRSYAPHSELPAWQIVPPEPAADLKRHYQRAEAEFGVGWEYLAAINLIETGMGRIRGDSVADARGPMQFIDETWERYGEGDVTDPRDAILGAGRYLAARGFAAGDREAIEGALYSYNNHPAYVRAIRLHAELMEREPRAYLGYHAWDVVFLTERGDVTLPVGYDTDRPIPVDRWLADNPQP